MAAIVTRHCLQLTEAFIRERLGDKGFSAVLKSMTIFYRPPQVVTVQQLAMYKRAMVRAAAPPANTAGLPTVPPADGAYPVLCFPRGMLPRFEQLGMLEGARIVVDVPERTTRFDAPTIELSGNQQVIHDWIMRERFTPARAAAGRAWVNLKLAAGSGKTLLALALARSLGVKTLFVVPTDYLREQTIEERDFYYDVDAGEVLPGVPVMGSYAGGPKRNKRDGDVVVGIINSLLKATPEYLAQFGFVVFDEAHDYCSNSFSEIFWKCQAAYMMSMTATPDERIDGFDRALSYQFGDLVDGQKLPGFQADEVRFEGDITVINYTGPPEYTRQIVCESTGIVSVPLMMQNIVNDPYRSSMISRTLKEQYDIGRHTIAFGETRIYTGTLRAELMYLGCRPEDEMDGAGGMADGAAIGVDGAVAGGVAADDGPHDAAASGVHVLMGGSKKEEIVKVKADQPRSIITTTWGYSRRGVSIKRLDTLFITTPRARGMTQVVGRIMRKGADATIRRRIFDLVDTATVLRNQLRSRMKTYKALGWPVTMIDVKWQDIAVIPIPRGPADAAPADAAVMAGGEPPVVPVENDRDRVMEAAVNN